MQGSVWNYINQYVAFNTIHWNDLLDIIILSFLLYEIINFCFASGVDREPRIIRITSSI